MRSRFACVLVLTCACSLIARADDHALVFSGTVNIVLANSNGIVALTDSNASARLANGLWVTSRDPSQKLFQIDDSTVCTIAGFGSTDLQKFPNINSATTGMIDSFTEQLKTHAKPLTFDDKLRMLKFVLDFQLSVIGNLGTLDQLDDVLEVILSGYDLDGTPRITKMKFSATIDPRGALLLNPPEVTSVPTGKELTWATAGVGGSDVEYALAHPDYLTDDYATIKHYAEVKARDSGASLATVDLVRLAKDLAIHSAKVNKHAQFTPNGILMFQPIGGPDQVAVLEKRSVEDLQLPRLPWRPVNNGRVSLVLDESVDCGGGPATPIASDGDLIIIAIEAHYKHCPNVYLDNVYYSKGDFEDSTFHYAGGIFAFDPSNRLTNTTLLLDPGVDRTRIEVKTLIALPWKRVASEAPRDHR